MGRTANPKRRLSIDFRTEEAMTSFFMEVIEPYFYEAERDVEIFKRDTLDSKTIPSRHEYIVKAKGDRPHGDYSKIIEELKQGSDKDPL